MKLTHKKHKLHNQRNTHSSDLQTYISGFLKKTLHLYMSIKILYFIFIAMILSFRGNK